MSNKANLNKFINIICQILNITTFSISVKIHLILK